MKYTILIVTGLGDSADALAELLVAFKCSKGDSKDWDNPLADWLESLNAAIESAEGE
jgi:hypothetical protein